MDRIFYQRMEQKSITALYDKIVSRSEDSDKLSKSDIKKLLSGIKNSSEILTEDDYHSIKGASKTLRKILKNQNSAIFEGKDNGINEAFCLAYDKLSPDAKRNISEVDKETLELCKNDIEVYRNKLSEHLSNMLNKMELA